jgi:hypothetical protein
MARLLALSYSGVEKLIRILRHAERGDQSEVPVNLRFAYLHSFLTIDEDGTVLQWIRDCQRHGRCPSSPEVRRNPAELYKSRRVTEKPFVCEWWKSFTCPHKARYADGHDASRPCDHREHEVFGDGSSQEPPACH